MDYILELLVIVLIAVVTIVFLIERQHKYWKRRGLHSLKPKFPFGNAGNPFTRKLHIGILIQNIYNEVRKAGVRHSGIYMLTNPVYIPVDPNILKNVLAKDFQYFYDRGFYHNEKNDPLSANLFAISGTKWRNLRTKLTPTFSSGKMKMMFNTMVECAIQMRAFVSKYDGNANGIEIKDTLARYTTDVIGSCAFGLECNSFENEHAEFRRYGKRIFQPISSWRSFLNTFAFVKPDLARVLGIRLFSQKVNEFFINVVRDTINYRKTKQIKRNDMLQLLMDLEEHLPNNNSNQCDEKPLSINEIAAQVFVFFVAGFDTSSSTMAFCLYELAVNLQIQSKVRDEINRVLENYNGKITYEAIMEMKYMGQVIDETLRKYPPLTHLSRTCVKNYNIPDTDITIEKGTRMFISILGFHHDPQYFTNPENFDPERFSEENKSKIRPFTYIPFGEGPRICIGLRFGIMQIKIGLTVLLRNHVISLNKKTILPFEIDRYNFILAPKHGIWLNIGKTEENT